MPDYSKGQIYTIRFFENDNIIYIGSTVQPLAVRFGGHKRNTNTTLFKYIQEHYKEDFKCCYIELFEVFICSNKQELNKREGEIIRDFKANKSYIVLNKIIPCRTPKEHYNDNIDKLKERYKKYYNDNIDKITERKKQLQNKRNEQRLKEKEIRLKKQEMRLKEKEPK